MRRMYSKNQLAQEVQNVVSSGELENVKVFENIVDKDGHKRFIEGDITKNDTYTLVTKTFGKYSLSGTHLMFVFACTFDIGTTNAGIIAEAELPEWVHDKIVSIASNYIDTKIFTARDDSYSTPLQISCALLKLINNKIGIGFNSNITTTVKENVRIAFDLLIDNE